MVWHISMGYSSGGGLLSIGQPATGMADGAFVIGCVETVWYSNQTPTSG